ncbi:hypothetical protein FQN54_006919 [Arachnomyces sp. PD_36]|nr:hypothetical protein FQN54_006919 [Arachnomyces sp. PD_36]
MASDNTTKSRSQQNLMPETAMSHGESGDSDPEHQHQLEVLFGPAGDHRRKSSLVSDDTPWAGRRHDPKRSRRNTPCFVHSLLGADGKEDLYDRLRGISDACSRPTAALNSGLLDHGDDTAVVDFDNRHRGETSTEDIVHSRLLTKGQLSDMAWNVRALSKKLGGVKLKLKVRTVFILTKAYDESLVALTRQLTQWLLAKERDYPYIVYVDQAMKSDRHFDAEGLIKDEPSAEGRLRYWDEKLAHDHPHTFDFAITLGGDGTVLYTSWLFQRIVPPVMSFSLGSLGFLTKFDFENYQESLTSAFRDGVAISLRLRFECTIMRSKPRSNGGSGEDATRDLVDELIGEETDDDVTHTPDRMFEILNDIVVDRGPNPSMSTPLLSPLFWANE